MKGEGYCCEELEALSSPARRWTGSHYALPPRSPVLQALCSLCPPPGSFPRKRKGSLVPQKASHRLLATFHLHTPPPATASPNSGFKLKTFTSCQYSQPPSPPQKEPPKRHPGELPALWPGELPAAVFCGLLSLRAKLALAPSNRHMLHTRAQAEHWPGTACFLLPQPKQVSVLPATEDTRRPRDDPSCTESAKSRTHLQF